MLRFFQDYPLNPLVLVGLPCQWLLLSPLVPACLGFLFCPVDLKDKKPCKLFSESLISGKGLLSLQQYVFIWEENRSGKKPMKYHLGLDTRQVINHVNTGIYAVSYYLP